MGPTLMLTVLPNAVGHRRCVRGLRDRLRRHGFDVVFGVSDQDQTAFGDPGDELLTVLRRSSSSRGGFLDLGVIADRGVTAVICDGLSPFGAVVADALGLPAIVMHTTLPPKAHARGTWSPTAMRHHALQGLPQLVACPEAFEVPEWRIRDYHYVDALIDESEPAEPAGLDGQLDGRPLVYVSLGTRVQNTRAAQAFLTGVWRCATREPTFSSSLPATWPSWQPAKRTAQTPSCCRLRPN